MQARTIFSICVSLARIGAGIQWIREGSFKLMAGFQIGGLFPAIASNTDSPHWYKIFIAHAAAPYPGLFNIMIPWGELLVGLGLTLGLLTLPALIGGLFMDLNYILADMVYIYPVQIACGILLILLRKEAEAVSLDRLIRHYRLHRRKLGKSAKAG